MPPVKEKRERCRVDIPIRLRRRLRIAAAEQDKALRELIEEILEDYLTRIRK